MLRFVGADKITDVESAERTLSKYKNKEVEMKLNHETFRANLLDAKVGGGDLYVKFTWKHDGTDSGIESMERTYRQVHNLIGKAATFQVNTDSFFGLVASATDLPGGAAVSDYADSPFVIVFAFNEKDQDPAVVPVTAKVKGSALVVPIPTNIQEQLRLDPDLEHDPHVTVAYFPELTLKKVEMVLRCAGLAAKKTGTFSVAMDSSTTFPTPQDDGTYPHVALVKSQGLLDFHDEFIDLIERFSPGLADTTFAHKNYTPHVTLEYVSGPGVVTPVKSMAWTVDHLYLSYKGGIEFLPVPLSNQMKKADKDDAFLQVGEARVPVTVVSNKNSELRVRLKKSSQASLIDEMEGLHAKLVTPRYETKMEIQEVRESGKDGFHIFYRPLVSYMSKSSAAKLRYVADVARDRGHLMVASKISSLLDFTSSEDEEDEDEDTEALGPGSPGVDPHIVKYVKAPQTQQIVEEPKFTRSLPLHERI